MPPTVERRSDGNVFGRNRDDQNFNLTPGILDISQRTQVTRGGNTISNRFKLVTVRKVTDNTAATLKTTLENQQKQLEAAALRSGSPTPYPITYNPTDDDVQQLYAVYVDEDLGNKTPVYYFQSPSPKIKAFITANGEGKDDWSVHIAHMVTKKSNTDGTYTITWRIYSIDNKTPDIEARVDYLLEDSALPECFRFNYEIDNLTYLGGGCWTGIAIDPDDRIPIYGNAPDDGRFFKVGQTQRYQGISQVKSLVQYSCTPTYSFTWCRGKLELTKRKREFSHILDKEETISTGVITATREHTYSLDIIQRPEIGTGSTKVDKVVFNEFSNGKARYVGSTNYKVGSRYQTPDYGTDAARLAIQSYQMDTNVVRPRQAELNFSIADNKISRQPISHVPILAASPDMSVFLRINYGNGKGSIEHGYEAKATAGSRGYQYGEDYKLWWGYGKVVSFYPTNDGARYRLNKTNGLRVKIGTVYDLPGELRQSPDYPNAVETTWEAMKQPQTGFFGFEEGSLSFIVVYNNPPLIGHGGVYYYEIPPVAIGKENDAIYDARYDEMNSPLYSNSNVAGNDSYSRQNSAMMAYSQMAGAISGGGLTSVNIGVVTIAGSDGESVVVRDPTPDMLADIRANPDYFPNGFWDSDYMDDKVNDANARETIYYTSDGAVIAVENT